MKTTVLLILGIIIAGAAEERAIAKVTRLGRGDIVDLSSSLAGNCKSGWGSRIRIAIATKTESFVYSYCSEQPLSAYMDEVYPKLREFVTGPQLGSCQLKTYCDAYNRCSYEQGQLQETSSQLVLLSNDKNSIDAEAYDDIQVSGGTICRPLSCR